jgi:uncharacterized protein YegL
MGLPNARLTPVYLVIDVSWSMSMQGKLEAVNRMIGAIADALRGNPAVARRVRMGVIDFSHDARVRLQLCDLADPGVEPPQLQVRSGTSFSSAFTVLRQQLDADLTRRPELGPPTVFFMSDGSPTDDECAWRTAFAALVAHRSRPAVVPCGMDEAETHVMGSLIHPLAGPARTALFMMADGAAAATAITGVGEILVAALLRPGAGNGRLSLPDRADLPAGVRRHEPEEFG